MVKNPPSWYDPHNRDAEIPEHLNPRIVPTLEEWIDASKDKDETGYRIAFGIAEKLDDLAELLRLPATKIVNKPMLIDFAYAKAESLRNQVETMRPRTLGTVASLVDEHIKLVEKIEAMLKDAESDTEGA